MSDGEFLSDHARRIAHREPGLIFCIEVPEGTEITVRPLRGGKIVALARHPKLPGQRPVDSVATAAAY